MGKSYLISKDSIKFISSMVAQRSCNSFLMKIQMSLHILPSHLYRELSAMSLRMDLKLNKENL